LLASSEARHARQTLDRLDQLHHLRGGADADARWCSRLRRREIPNWKGQWTRHAGGGQWDPTKPPGRGQQAPLTEEYVAIMEAGIASQRSGGQGVNSTPTCLPPGMPRAMIVYEPMEIVVTPEVTYILIEFMHQIRRIYTDGRDWPEQIEPSFAGYSIGRWEDTDGDGRFDALVIETRGMKGPRSFDGTVPLHKDNRTTVKERIYLDKSDGNVLHDELTTTDSALTRPWTGPGIIDARRRRNGSNTSAPRTTTMSSSARRTISSMTTAI
jgi:hypothetical protein